MMVIAFSGAMPSVPRWSITRRRPWILLMMPTRMVWIRRSLGINMLVLRRLKWSFFIGGFGHFLFFLFLLFFNLFVLQILYDLSDNFLTLFIREGYFFFLTELQVVGHIIFDLIWFLNVNYLFQLVLNFVFGGSLLLLFFLFNFVLIVFMKQPFFKIW